jgi:hypothetical protein
MPRTERPLDAGDSRLLSFAADLRRLRRDAGNPTYRQLAQRAHFSVSALSEAAGGRKLPSLAVTLAYVRACGGDEHCWKRRWHALAAELVAGTASSGPVAGSDADPTPSWRAPYVGLRPFGPADVDRFCGRERLVENLLSRLSRQRLLACFGASGAGTSSLLRAGLVPGWQRTHPAGLVVIFTPGAHPIEECAIALAGVTGGTTARVRAEMTADARGLHRTIRRAVGSAADPADPPELLLVVDQFEEVFTLCRDLDEQARFIQALLIAERAQRSRCRVVLGVRADAYAHCARHPELADALDDAQVTVGPMTLDELRRVICEPAVRAGYAIESGLLAALVTSANGRVGALPLLSNALLETWRRRRGNTLTLAGFEDAGGVGESLAHTAETTYRAMEPARQRQIRRLFLRLTAPGEGTDHTKRRVGYAELGSADPDTRQVLESLARHRLITLDRDGVDMGHEALIRCWPRLRDWLAEDGDGLRIHRHLTDAASGWDALGQDPGALYRGARLAVAAGWAAQRDRGLSPLEARFLEASRAVHAAEERAARQVRRLRMLVAALSVLLVTATGAAVLAARERRVTRQRGMVTPQRVAEQAAALRGFQPALAAQLSLPTHRLAPTIQARSSLLSTLTAPYATEPDGGGEVDTVAVSPDGRTMATAGPDRVVALWDIADPHHPGPDGDTVAAAGHDTTIQLWSAGDRQRPRALATLHGPAGPANAVAFRPDGRILTSAGHDATVRLWDVADLGARPLGVIGHPESVTSVARSPDGRLLASASGRTVRLSDLADPRRPALLATLTGTGTR